MSFGNPPNHTEIEEVVVELKKAEIQLVYCVFVEMTGRAKARLIPLSEFENVAKHGLKVAGFAAGNLGQGAHDASLLLRLDLNTLTILPLSTPIAWITGDLYFGQEPWNCSPRVILRKQIDTGLSYGYQLRTGIDCEFTLIRKSEDELNGIKPYDVLDQLQKAAYDALSTYRRINFLEKLVNLLYKLEWKPETIDHEDAQNQFEIGWRFSDCLQTCDRYLLFKFIVQVMAEDIDAIATFMPKPFAHLKGNSAHLNQSLWDIREAQNIFYDPNDNLKLSQLGYSWIGGMKAHAEAITAIAMSTVNSYKRRTSVAPISGSHWTPGYVTYGPDNRSQMIRVSGAGYIELRTMDGVANPYLATAICIASGMDGILRKLSAGEPNNLNLFDPALVEEHNLGIARLPENLLEALNCAQNDSLFFDTLGSHYAKLYLQEKKKEWLAYHDYIAQWEIEQYLL